MSELIVASNVHQHATSTSTAVVRVGVGCFVTDPTNHPGKVLMGTRKGSHGAGKMALPGGHLDMNESWETCAAREVQEETNLSITNARLFNVTNDIAIDGNPLKHYITLFMYSTIAADSPPLENLEPHKCESWNWISWSEILQLYTSEPERLFEPMRNLITTVNQEEPHFLKV